MRWQLFIVIIGFMGALTGQAKVGSERPSLSDRDIGNRLRSEGIRFSRPSVTVWFENTRLTRHEMSEFAGLASKGVTDIQHYLRGVPAARPHLPVQIFVSSYTTISHTVQQGVFLPIERVKNKDAPYLHELTHVFAPCDHCPLWFSEGFASFVQSYISEHYGGYDGAVFARCGNQGIDKESARWKATPEGAAVMPFLGRFSEPPTVTEDRLNVAAPFYVMSQSLVKFLIENIGRTKVLKLLTATDFNVTLASVSGQSMAQWKRQWLAEIS